MTKLRVLVLFFPYFTGNSNMDLCMKVGAFKKRPYQGVIDLGFLYYLG
jgi:hypothetical protein